MYEHQLRFIENPASHIGMVGGYGSGKTYAIAAKAVYLSAENPGLHGGVIEPTHRMARDIMLPTLSSMLDSAGIGYVYSKYEAKFRLQNRSEIWLRSSDNPDSLKGPNWAWALLDEADLMSQDVWVIALSRARHPKAKRRCVALATTSEGLSWIYHTFKVHHSDDEDYHLIDRINTRENKSLPPEYVKALMENMSADQVAAYIEGDMRPPMDGRIFPSFDRARHVVPNPPDGPVDGIGTDFNVHPATACIVQEINCRPCVVDYYTEPNSSTLDLGKKLFQKYGDVPIFPDHTGGARSHATGESDFNILRQCGFRTLRSKPTHRVKDKFNHINTMLRDAAGNVRLTFAERCVARKHREFPSIVESLEGSVYNKNHTDFSDALYSHSCDGLSYYLMNRYPIRRPMPPILPTGEATYA